MATKPTIANSAWATDANFSAGPASGTATKVSASAGVKAQGWRPGDALGYVGAWFNYWFNQIYLWVTYVDDLHNSADFLNKSYTWLTGTHRFTGGLRSAGVSLESGDLIYSDSSGVATPRARFQLVPLVALPSFNGSVDQWSRAGAGNLYCTSTTGGNGTGILPLKLAHGVKLTSVHAWVRDPGGGDTVQLEVYRLTQNIITGANTYTQLGSTDTSAGTGPAALELLDVTGLTEVVDTSAHTYEVWVTATLADGNSNVAVVWAQTDDPGFVGNR